MKAPMSENLKKILADQKKSKILAGQILLSRQTGRNPVIKVNNKKIELVRTGSYSN
jgi:hypothetical protein